MWLSGDSSASVIETCGNEGVGFLQDGLIYRLTGQWKRFGYTALQLEESMKICSPGTTAVAVEIGSINRSVMTLIRNGLSSREAAQRAVELTNAEFTDFDGMIDWLRSDEVRRRSAETDWPNPQSRYSWLKFYESEERSEFRAWTREAVRIDLNWLEESVVGGDQVVIENADSEGGGCKVMTPDL